MPIYEYQCEECQNRIEKLMKLSDEAPVICPKCSKPALKKMVSAAAFRLKGSGWYETDFKTGSKKNVLHGGASSDSSSGNSGSGSSGSSGSGSSGSGTSEKSSSGSKSSGSDSSSGTSPSSSSSKPSSS
ncbi:MAG: zinc ribbon domain-containing protein [SAR86 cluster bacterium]